MAATASVLAIREVSVDDILTAGQVLFVQHWREVAANRDAQHLRLDELRYRALDQQGAIFCLGAYDGDVLVGYSIALMSGPHLHDVEMWPCVSDAIYVAEAYRNKGLGARLMADTEKQAKVFGATLMVWHAMAGSDLDERLSQSTRYIAQDVSYTRKL
jgi:GNAT superfamily N-acetyltransferase